MESSLDRHPEPGGFEAISRWLSAATPPVTGHHRFFNSVSRRDDSLVERIANQEEHHRVKSFREELVEMLNRAGIEYDPKYLD